MNQLIQVDITKIKKDQKSKNWFKNRQTNIKNNCPDSKINADFTLGGFDDLGTYFILIIPLIPEFNIESSVLVWSPDLDSQFGLPT